MVDLFKFTYNKRYWVELSEIVAKFYHKKNMIYHDFYYYYYFCVNRFNMILMEILIIELNLN